MRYVAVIDLMAGQVVRAREGRRDRYRPIRTPLADGADPVSVATALVRGFGLETLYAADLDAITGRGDNLAALARIEAALPGVALWLDCGLKDMGDVARVRAGGARIPVIGSESLVDGALPAQLAAEGRHWILSLDFRGEDFLGPPELLATPACWPRDIIAMNLARVGSGAGPDLPLLARLRALAPACRVHAAGGVRGADDLAALARAGAAGVLLASALHDGLLAPADLRSS